MKKYLILVLALVLALGLSMPAMAFTSDSEAEDDSIPYSLKIYLVEYDDNDLFGFVSLPESDRGYAKNEIVAAVVELDVPEDEEITTEDYGTLVFGGDNVTLDVADNYENGDITLLTSKVTAANVTLDDDLVDDEIHMDVIKFAEDTTYKWLFFAKVTDDDASLYAKLTDGAGSIGFETTSSEIDGLEGEISWLEVTLDGTVYTIYHGIDQYDPDHKDLAYLIFWENDDGDDQGLAIYTDKDDASIGMSILLEDGVGGLDYYDLAVDSKGKLGVQDPANPAKVLISGDTYDDVMDVYEDVAVDVFGFDYFLIGNYVRESFFEDLVSPDTLVATVDIAPWTAYVTVPDNIVVDPPKTGDAASIMGFVMVALSGAGVVALRKRG